MITVPVANYLALITSQYQNSPKFLSWLTAPLQLLQDTSLCGESIDLAFDLTSAVGSQLDILGEIIGQSRILNFQPTDGSSPVLDDAIYRKILILKTLTNFWNGTQKSIYTAWKKVMPDIQLLIQDNQDMTATITVTGNVSQTVKDMIHNDLIIPRPEGVLYNYGTITTYPIFGYDVDTQYFAGYNESYWDCTIF